MARRRNLKGIAHGIGSSFMSRNNDMNGWWALGVLYALADRAKSRSYVLDLLSGKSVPPDEDSWRVAAPYRAFLADQLSKKGLEDFQVAAALVTIEFDQPSKKPARGSWGEPFVCRVKLTDDLGRVHHAEYFGTCGKDPTKGQRSIRRYANPAKGIVAKFGY